MLRWRVINCALLSCFGVALSARDLSSDDLNLLKDPGGWEYLSLSNPDNGIQTKHTCFDGKPHPKQCRGTLHFSVDGSFSQAVYIHGKKVQRHGKYDVDNDQLSFFDESGIRDGPYRITLDPQAKTLTLNSQAVRIELELETEYKKQRAAH